MLRAIGRRGERATAIAVLVALLAVALVPGGAVASASAPAPGLGYETEAHVSLEGVELDPRFGRAWLLARLSGEGHLRTVSARLKAFAPPGEYEAGFVRIPLIPKLPVAKRLRRDGRVAVTVSVYFRPKGKIESATLSRRVLLIRRHPTGPTRAHH